MLPTIIVRHRKEYLPKCTLTPLEGREDLRFYTWPDDRPDELGGYVRLALEGPPLGPEDAGAGLLLLDATWRYVKAMNEAFAEVPGRTLPPIETAYPRRSKLQADPREGLASVEALFAAYHLLGRDTSGLLDDYYWREEFLSRNADLFGEPV